jgi:hypothetical protein
MTLQWASITLLLYTEIVICLVLLIHWIPSRFWLNFFNTSLGKSSQKWGWICIFSIVVALVFLFIDAIREIRRLSHILEIPDEDLHVATYFNETMRLFHAQRNYYITGFCLVLLLLLNRIVALISKNANLELDYKETLEKTGQINESIKNLLKGEKVDTKEKELALECLDIEENIRKIAIEYEDLEDQVTNLQVEYEKICKILNATKND